ncbi:unnamed protein product [Owenia fusiformis]|uniref:Uncharacterized protein n=1 Tax=Owenia fusiformis TaxID=6347 RepID=A0A8J1XTM8_OWEFU|nr:unnamed protein product [Owenia fusiformis]
MDLAKRIQCFSVIIYCLLAANVALKVKKAPRDTAAKVGSTVILHCHVEKSRHDHFVQWFGYAPRPDKYGGQISANGEIVISAAESKYSVSRVEPYNLIITNLDKDDGGRYKCNDAYTGDAIGGVQPHLVVLSKLRCPEEVTTLNENQTFHINCSVNHTGAADMKMVPHFKWIMNASPMTRAVTQTGLDSTTTTVSMIAYPSLHGTELTCGYEVMGMHDQCYTKLEVRYAPRPPRIKIHNKDVTKKNISARLGEGIILDCVTSGFPSPTFTWLYKDHDGIFKHLAFESKFKLYGLMMRHTGEYMCAVKNDVNKVGENTTVYLKIVDSQAHTSEVTSHLKKGVIAGTVIVVILCTVATVIILLAWRARKTHRRVLKADARYRETARDSPNASPARTQRQGDAAVRTRTLELRSKEPETCNCSEAECCEDLTDRTRFIYADLDGETTEPKTTTAALTLV